MNDPTPDPTLLILGGRRGRRPRADAVSTRRIEFRVTEAEHAQLERVAVANRESVASVIRQFVNEGVSDFAEQRIFCPVRNRE